MHSRSNNVKQNEAQSKGEDVLLVGFMFLIFTRMARESFSSWATQVFVVFV